MMSGGHPQTDAGARRRAAVLGDAPARRLAPGVLRGAAGILVAGALVGTALGLAARVDGNAAPTARLAPTGAAQLDAADRMLVLEDSPVLPGSLVAFESFEVLDVWTGYGELGQWCLIAADAHRNPVFEDCAAPGREPTLDVLVIGPGADLPADMAEVGTVIRLVARDDGMVDVYVILPREPGRVRGS